MPERDDTPRWVAAGGILVLVLALVLAVAWLVRDRPLTTSVPQPPPLTRTAIVSLDPHATACLSRVTLIPDGDVAHIRVGAGSGPPTPLTVTASGPGGYRATARVAPTWVDNATIAIPIRPPAQPLDGRFCVRNDGDHAVALYAADDRAKTAALTSVDGRPEGANFELAFTEARPESLARNASRIARAVGAFAPSGGRAVLLLFGLCVIVGLPAALTWTLARASREDA